MKIFLLLFLIFSSLGTTSAVAPLAQYRIRFGTLSIGENELFVFDQETVILPKKTREEGLIFGFEMIPPDYNPYTYRFVIYPPSPPKRIEGELKDAKMGEPAMTITSGLEKAKGGGLIYPLWLDEDDPLGKWKIEIFINEKLIKTVHFQVIPK